MSTRFIWLAVVVASLTGYHIAQRSVPSSLRPAPLFAFVYSVAALIMVVAAAATGATGLGAVRQIALQPASWLVALTVSGIELGIYGMYKSGWSLSITNILTQMIVSVILVAVGVAAFGEDLTRTRSIGLLLCIVGAGMVAR